MMYFSLAATLTAHKEMNLLGKNLLEDSQVSDTTMAAPILGDSQESWEAEVWTPKSKYDPPPSGLPVYSTAKNIDVMRNQLVDLYQHGFSPAFLKKHRPELRIKSW